jgi:hypothetical protein
MTPLYWLLFRLPCRFFSRDDDVFSIPFGGFFTNALKLMESMDAVATAELVIILAAPALVLFLGEKAVSGSNQA